MLQTMISNIPAILIGVIIGSAVATPAASELMSVSLVFFGMEKIQATAPLYGIITTLAGILLVALVTSFMCSLSIRKVEPVGLLAEE